MPAKSQRDLRDKPTYDELVDTLHDAHKVLDQLLTQECRVLDDTQRARLSVLYAAGDALHAAGHVDHNPRARLSAMFERLARSEVGTIDSTIIVGEIDWEQAAELILRDD